MSNDSKSIIRWAGSKRQLLPILRAKLPLSWGTYIEPFAGSACLFFDYKPAKAIIGDINVHLINAYSVLRDYPEQLFDALKDLIPERTEYYRVRALDPQNLSHFDQAVRFLYLNRYCYNGVYRTNKNGAFNVPMGSKLGSFPPRDHFLRTAALLHNANILAGDYSVLLEYAKNGDFVYLDPPYRTSRPRGEFGAGSFNQDQEPRLIELVNGLTQRGVKYLLSYTGNAGIDSHALVNASFEHVEVVRKVASATKHRHKTTEILLWNF